MSSIKIESGQGWAKVFVDGQKLRHLTRMAVDFTDPHAPVLGVSMHMRESAIDMTGAKLKVDGLEVPAAVELALLEYLCRKYPVSAAVERVVTGLDG